MLLIQVEAEGAMLAHIKQKLPDQVSLENLGAPRYAESGFNQLFIDTKRDADTYAPTRFIQGIVHRLCGDVRPLAMTEEGANGVLNDVAYDFKEDVIASNKEVIRFQAKHHKKGKGFIDCHADSRDDLDSRGKVLYDTNIFAILNLSEGDLLKLWNGFTKACPEFSDELTNDLISTMKLLTSPKELLAESKLETNDNPSALLSGITGKEYQDWFTKKLTPACKKEKGVLDFYSVVEANDSNRFRFNDTLVECEFKIKRYLLLYLAVATLAVTKEDWLKAQINFNKTLINYFAYLIELRTAEDPKKVKSVKREILISNAEYFVALFGSAKYRQEQHSIMVGRDKVLVRDLKSNIMVKSNKKYLKDRLLHEKAIKEQIEMASVVDFTYGKKGLARLLSVRIVPDN